MKNLKVLIIVFLFFNCDDENAVDCFKTSGALIRQEFQVESFNKIKVNRDIELILKQGETQKIVVETGLNLIDEFSLEVLDNQLILTNDNTCNFVRDYGVSKIYVTSPNIKEIRSSTQYDISSEGVLNYPSLTILSEDFNDSESFTVGDFRLNINCQSFWVTFNSLSNCYISGNTNTLNVSFFAGNSRFEGEGLIAQNVNISHRSSNDIIVNPQQSIQGIIRSTGNVISINQPPSIDVEELYKGRLIFK
ncbi:DUF2807 domain-containing protein [Seonamhaeicola sp. MEBiC1930]|uniref:head GIN domain-containing protein n=1 Tax=Seonamhaeicola sp. MEBiC01930 TaxID=2976768 RepID=UPI003255A983